MYLGRVVEIGADRRRSSTRPNHPYTQALLAEVRRVEPREAHVRADQGRDPVAARAAVRLPFPSALPARDASAAASRRRRCGRSRRRGFRACWLNVARSVSAAVIVHAPYGARIPLVLDSPHSGERLSGGFRPRAVARGRAPGRGHARRASLARRARARRDAGRGARSRARTSIPTAASATSIPRCWMRRALAASGHPVAQDRAGDRPRLAARAPRRADLRAQADRRRGQAPHRHATASRTTTR